MAARAGSFARRELQSVRTYIQYPLDEPFAFLLITTSSITQPDILVVMKEKH